MVVLIVCDVDLVDSEVLVSFRFGLNGWYQIAIDHLFPDVLVMYGLNSELAGGLRRHELLPGGQALNWFSECLFPLPPEVSELISRLHKLLGAEEPLTLKLLVGSNMLGVEEFLDASEQVHQNDS